MNIKMLEYIKKIREATTPLDILLNVDYLCDILDASGEKERESANKPHLKGEGHKHYTGESPKDEVATSPDSKPDVLCGDKK